MAESSNIERLIKILDLYGIKSAGVCGWNGAWGELVLKRTGKLTPYDVQTNPTQYALCKKGYCLPIPNTNQYYSPQPYAHQYYSQQQYYSPNTYTQQQNSYCICQNQTILNDLINSLLKQAIEPNSELYKGIQQFVSNCQTEDLQLLINTLPNYMNIELLLKNIPSTSSNTDNINTDTMNTDSINTDTIEEKTDELKLSDRNTVDNPTTDVNNIPVEPTVAATISTPVKDKKGLIDSTQPNNTTETEKNTVKNAEKEND